MKILSTTHLNLGQIKALHIALSDAGTQLEFYAVVGNNANPADDRAIPITEQQTQILLTVRAR